MLYIYAERFDVTENLEKFLIFNPFALRSAAYSDVFLDQGLV